MTLGDLIAKLQHPYRGDDNLDFHKYPCYNVTEPDTS